MIFKLLLLLPCKVPVTQVGISCDNDIPQMAGFVFSFHFTDVSHHDINKGIFNQT